MIRNKIKNVKFLRALAIRWRNLTSGYSFRTGRNNKIVTDGIRMASPIQIKGSHNLIIIHKDAVVNECHIKVLGNNARIEIGGNAYLWGVELHVEDNGCAILIGRDTFIGHHTHIACTEDNRKITIGDNSMISSFVQIRTGDSHSILDAEGKRINYADDVILGNHCWIGEGSKILKGVSIGNNCVVSTGAIVTKSFENNILLAGIPAKAIKSNISWDKNRL